jgi:DNA-binding NarL/FixJ family response regulator
MVTFRRRKMPNIIRVIILDDHPGIIECYNTRLEKSENILVIGKAHTGEQLEEILTQAEANLLLLDISVPTSDENENPYPILHVIPSILERYPELNVLVISMHAKRTLVEAVMEAGASGYILKDDRDSFRNLAEIITSVNDGGIYLSGQVFRLIQRKAGSELDKPLTQRMKQVLSLCASNPDTSTIKLASAMNIAPSTVRNLLSSSYMRLGVSNRYAAVVKARQLGLITPKQDEYEL